MVEYLPFAFVLMLIALGVLWDRVSRLEARIIQLEGHLKN